MTAPDTTACHTCLLMFPATYQGACLMNGLSPETAWYGGVHDRVDAELAAVRKERDVLREQLDLVTGLAAVCHDYGPAEWYDLEDTALKARRTLESVRKE